MRGLRAPQVSFTVEETMKQPVYVYYQLNKFYQNHRTYVKSRSDKQLLGELLLKDELSDCAPRKSAKVRNIVVAEREGDESLT